MLKLDHVVKRFKDITILNGITLDIKKAHVVGLAGPSGGGKSTLLGVFRA